jgi:5-methylcytosine-specific restriction endonuclease McrA
MNLTAVLLGEDKKPVFMGEMGMVKRIPKKTNKKLSPQEGGSGRKSMFKKNSKCHYCRCEMELSTAGSAKQKNNTATIDHKTPICRGGKKLGSANKVLACALCNKDKGHLTEGEYLAVLAYRASHLNN